MAISGAVHQKWMPFLDQCPRNGSMCSHAFSICTMRGILYVTRIRSVPALLCSLSNLCFFAYRVWTYFLLIGLIVFGLIFCIYFGGLIVFGLIFCLSDLSGLDLLYLFFGLIKIIFFFKNILLVCV